MPSLYKRLFVRKHIVMHALLAVMMLLNVKASAQWALDGQVQVELGKKYLYTPKYNGTSAQPYCGEYHYYIYGGYAQDRTYFSYYDGFNDCIGGGTTLKDAALSITWFDKAGRVEFLDANWNLLASMNVSKGGYDLTGPMNITQGPSYKYTLSCNGPGNPAVCAGSVYISGGYFTSTGDSYMEGGFPCSPNTSMDFDITWYYDIGDIYLYSTDGALISEIHPNNYAGPFWGGTLAPDNIYLKAGEESPLIMGTEAAGGGGPDCYEYSWEWSDDNVNWRWWDGGKTSIFQHWQPGVLYSDTYLRRGVWDCNGNVAYSNTVYIGVEPKTSFFFSPETQNVNYGTAPDKLRISLMYGPAVPEFRWQSSTDNINWTDLAVDRYSTEYQPGIVTTTTFYRVICTNAVPQVTSSTSVVKICSVSGGLQINGSSTCIKGAATQLTPNILGGQWGSSNPSVATIDNNGLVTGIAEGTTNITYIVTNPCGTHVTKFVITVIAAPPMTNLGKGIEYDPQTVVVPLEVNGVGIKNPYNYTNDNSLAHSIKNVLALKVDEEKKMYIPGDFSASVTLDLEYGHTESGKCNKKEVTLKVNYTKDGGAKYDALNYLMFEDAEFTQVTVKSVQAPQTVNGVTFNTKDVLELTNKMVITRYFQMADNVKPTLTVPSTIPNGADALPVSWTVPLNTNNNALQLEWTWLETGMEDDYKNSNGQFDPALVLNAGATRIDLTKGAAGGSYDIPFLYMGAGTLFVRARVVNIMPSGSRSDGPWSDIKQFVATKGHEDKLNWQATTSYAEEGKRKTVIQYYDGTLRSRQTVTKDNTTGKTVVAETMYDTEGRPAVQILPAPGIDNIIAYRENLNKFNNQVDNTNPAEFFDFTTTTSGYYGTAALDENLGTAKYYSDKNPDRNTGIHQNIPAANGYPYTVTRYTPDGTNRIQRQSSPGDAHKMGSNHETLYFYGTPLQEELNALFGTEVGDKFHYFKNMVQDANGQMNVTYLDMQGHTIATALAGENKKQDPLPGSDESPYEDNNRNLLSKETNLLKGNSIESVNSILVPFGTDYTFTYTLTKQTITLPKCDGVGTVTYDCKFDLQIVIADETGEQAPTVINENGIVELNKTYDPITLKVGSYNVRKTLKINQQWLDDLIAQYSAEGVGVCTTLDQLITTITNDDIQSSACGVPATEVTSSDCLAVVGDFETYKTRYAGSINVAVGSLTNDQLSDIRVQYDAEIAFCTSLDPKVSNTLVSIRQQMLADMIPYTGQYADKDKTASKYNIFSESGAGVPQPYFKYPKNEYPATNHYYNDLGTIDQSISAAKLLYMSNDEFAEVFSQSWAKALVINHPEYRKLKFAEDNLRESFNFIDKMQVDDVPSDPRLVDPFFNIAGQSNLKETIKDHTYGPAEGDYTMWRLAYGDALGCRIILNSSQRDDCYKNMPRDFTPTGSVLNTGATLTSALQSQAWTVYRKLYSQVRNEYVNNYINESDRGNENQSLIDEGYRLHFPKDLVEATKSNANASTLNGNSSNSNEWASMVPDADGNFPNINYEQTAAQYSHPCDSYINAWRQALLACDKLDERGDKEEILTSIITQMQAICRNGTDAANPYGASTAGTTSFEQVVKDVFSNKGIPLSEFCHPYGIEWPRPHGMNPIITKQYTSSVESCTCTQWTKLLQEMTQAGTTPSSLAVINTYLSSKYKETISAELYAGLLKCGNAFQVCPPVITDPGPCPECRVTAAAAAPNPNCTNIYSIPLVSPQPLPFFLVCGFDNTIATCFGCTEFVGLQTSFKGLFGKDPVLTGDVPDNMIVWNELFAKYVNYKTGLQHNWLYYADKFKSNGCPVGGIGEGAGASLLKICRDDKPLNDVTVDNPPSPCDAIRAGSKLKATIQYEYMKQKVMDDFRAAYYEKCLSAVEGFSVNYQPKEYHYTLYYYDRAGNLVKTVPPKGVHPNYTKAFIKDVDDQRAKMKKGLAYNENTPAHKLETRYIYNSLNKVVLQKTPDAGTTAFWYDELGRPVAAQNERQRGGNDYNYTLYDKLGRVTQTSQLKGTTRLDNTTAQKQSLLNDWYNHAYSSQNEVVQTIYDEDYGTVNGLVFKQNNLRNRVSYTRIWNKVTDNYPASATYYTYDVHGNVDELVQDFGQPGGIANIMNYYSPTEPSNQFKRIVYDYDLISGKVNKVSYQPGEYDAYYHRYMYDGETRLTDVYSGRDEVMLKWFSEREAHYDYYKHSPLASTTLGQLMVQKLDYAYTLQGWVKGVNPAFGGTLANGTNITETNPVADAFGFSLHYFDNDYKAIGYTPQTKSILGTLDASAMSLYNGNIAAMAVNIPKLGEAKVYNYHYDQLNRLVAMDAYNGLDVVAGKLTLPSTPPEEYKERISYDANGNILSYLRNGDAPRLSMDKLTYHYTAESNKLHKVTDEADDASDAAYSKYNDLRKNKPGTSEAAQSDNNYRYDDIGNLIADVSEGITGITWNSYGKMTSITKSTVTTSFVYDASGNRILKVTPSGSTAYVRDGSGNVLSVYTKSTTGKLIQSEVHLYGSSRLGTVAPHHLPDEPVDLECGFAKGVIRTFTRGEKLFELNNHLGNVLATVTDKRIAIPQTGNSVIDHYDADIASAQDYYPFGMIMPGRKENVGGYRYGFNGKENDNEMKGEGNQQDYGMRIYDPRMGKFLSVDPLTKDYPWYTPYQFAGNKPITFIDLDGLEEAPPPTPYKERENASDYKSYNSEDKNSKYSYVFSKETWPATLEYYDKTWTFTRTYNGGKEHWWLDGEKTWHKYSPDYKAYTPTPLGQFLSNASFTAEGGGEVTLGGQVGLKASIGAVKFSAELNGGSMVLGSGKLKYNSVEGFKPELGYLFKDGKAIFKQGIKLQVSTPISTPGGDLGIGGFYENQFSISQYGTMTQLGDDYGASVVFPVLSNNVQKLNENNWGTEFEKAAFNSMKKSDLKVNGGKKFFGLDFTFGLKFFLGVEAKAKLGVSY